MSLPAAGRIESPLRPNISVAYLRYCSALKFCSLSYPKLRVYIFLLYLLVQHYNVHFLPQTVVVIAYIVQGSAAEVRFISI